MGPGSALRSGLLLAVLSACNTEKHHADDSGWDPDPDTGCDSPRAWHPDADGDGYGAEALVEACISPDGYVTSGSDCDDGDADVHPGAAEICEDGRDGDCDGEDGVCVVEGSLASADLKLTGAVRGADAGRHMDVGDLNGDGAEDLVVGEMWARSYQGGAFVLSGPLDESGSLADLGVELSGGAGSFEGGRSVGVGDVTGDGLDDVLLGAPDASGYDAVLFFGPVVAPMEFAEADVLTFCSSAVECGHGADVADVDGDGVMDAIIGAGEERTGGSQTGAVYLLFGPLGTAELDLREEADARLSGATAGTETGRVIASGQDLDGDGISDLAITSGDDATGGPQAGAVLVALGPVEEDRSLADAEAALYGSGAYALAGEALCLGDLDGDGLADVIVGATGAAGGAGAVAAVRGPATGDRSLSEAELIVTGDGDEGLGSAVAARDVDGDGAAELLAGASSNREEGRGAGAAYLLWGPLEGALDSADAPLRLLGEARKDSAGAGVGFGALLADDTVSVLVGAPAESSGADAAGALYVLSL